MLVVGSEAEILAGQYHSNIKPNAALATVCTFELRYKWIRPPPGVTDAHVDDVIRHASGVLVDPPFEVFELLQFLVGSHNVAECATKGN